MSESGVIPFDWRGGLQREWQVLHGEHEQAERTAFWLKAGAVILTFATLAIAVDVLLAGLLLLVLWLQEGIVRTAQARVGARLLELEALMRAARGTADSAFQLYSGWLAKRGSGGALLAEYALHARRPTVAYPYVVLLFILLLAWLMPAAG